MAGKCKKLFFLPSLPARLPSHSNTINPPLQSVPHKQKQQGWIDKPIIKPVRLTPQVPASSCNAGCEEVLLTR
ncbi:hypothetical protein L249_6976 [Ophiocordyceps polyrhachis-furcata BCC 54312]|uniref:Uncharacterized protein n=1 Tax=Ophiocordyceps polyrhachis-furcata BCC 54312 TaxID=1330021 RepID=A0A367LJN7_9HYPO|nr:hypothetical protein L249_6976 [Ophiocordyceps polyrhachis-furcata BCC 54312]